MLPSTPTRSVHVGDGSQEAAKQRALRVLKQKKLYESQRDQLYSQQFNLDQVWCLMLSSRRAVDDRFQNQTT
jgi:hypothetical protein